jgi:Helix-turn-helix
MDDTLSDVLPDIARLLWKLRMERGLSCTKLARKAKVPLKTVLAYEANPAALTVKIASRMLDALGCHPGDVAPFGEPARSSASFPPPGLRDQMECKMLELEAALRIDQEAYQEALEKLEEALTLSPGKERTGRLLLSKAAVLGELGRERLALEALNGVERCLDATREPRLWLRLRLEQMYLLCQGGRFAEAESRRAEALDLASRVGDERDFLDARCLAGRVAAGLDRMTEALRILQPVRAELLAAERLFEAVAVGIDLAGALAGLSRLPEVSAMAGELEPLTRTKTLRAPARLALKTFCWTVQRNRLSPDLSRRLAAEFRRGGRRLRRPYLVPV